MTCETKSSQILLGVNKLYQAAVDLAYEFGRFCSCDNLHQLKRLTEADLNILQGKHIASVYTMLGSQLA